MSALCRDCFREPGPVARVCPACGSARLLRHDELNALQVAHVDCDAFYASVEKRDRPELADRPVIVGGGVRGVVTTACYIARIHGVNSAMPMFKALKACPDAVVIRPDFRKYSAVAREVRAMMQRLTPLVQPLSIDEAALDLAGTEALHGAAPAAVLARFARDVEAALGITVSIGLARNRLAAKLAAGRDKPRGFCLFGAEAPALLAAEPVGILPGVGPAQVRRLAALGLTRVGHLQALDARAAMRLLGEDGASLCRRARLEDDRRVDPVRAAKSVSAETTFDTDLAATPELERHLWRMAEKLGGRLREAELAAGGVVLKLKTARFASRTRAARLARPTRLPERLFEAARALLAREADGTAFRLVGIGAHPLLAGEVADPPDLADPDAPRGVARQAAIDALRGRYGAAIIGSGRALAPRPPAGGATDAPAPPGRSDRGPSRPRSRG